MFTLALPSRRASCLWTVQVTTRQALFWHILCHPKIRGRQDICAHFVRCEPCGIVGAAREPESGSKTGALNASQLPQISRLKSAQLEIQARLQGSDRSCSAQWIRTGPGEQKLQGWSTVTRQPRFAGRFEQPPKAPPSRTNGSTRSAPMGTLCAQEVKPWPKSVQCARQASLLPSLGQHGMPPPLQLPPGAQEGRGGS